jgi:hypothetical protein
MSAASLARIEQGIIEAEMRISRLLHGGPVPSPHRRQCGQTIQILRHSLAMRWQYRAAILAMNEERARAVLAQPGLPAR